MTSPPNDLNPAINLDHVAHFAPDHQAAAAALLRLGFTLTPFSAQSHRPDPAGPLLPAGTANRCAMLRQGYIEFLTPTHDTPNARELRAAIARYTGVHLIAFGTTAPHDDYARLTREGFTPRPPLALQREVDTGSGRASVRFTVVRVPPPAMAEGRIQYCQHHTPEHMWQTRWLEHANHAVALAGVLLCVADPAVAAQRYARFTGLPAQALGESWRIETARGYLLLLSPATLQRLPGMSVPALPWIAGYVIDSDDMSATARLTAGRALGERLLVQLPASLGGIVLFQPYACGDFDVNTI